MTVRRVSALAAAMVLPIVLGCGSPAPGGQEPSPVSASCVPTYPESLFVVESSARMLETLNPTTTRWDIVMRTVARVANRYQSSDVGLLAFPDALDRQCSIFCYDWLWKIWQEDESLFATDRWWWKDGDPNLDRACNAPDVQLAPGVPPGTVTAYFQQLEPAGNAPIGDALLSALNFFMTQGRTGAVRDIVLVVAGGDTCGADAVAMIQKLRSLNVRTWVLSFANATDVETLNRMADAGGTAVDGAIRYQVLRSAADIDPIMGVIGTWPDEVCDGVDNDCDGDTDEGLVQACADLCGGGMQACKGGVWGACDLSAVPGGDVIYLTPELCNGLDDDCDGEIDEGFELGFPCLSWSGVCSATGVTVCSADGKSTVCSAVAPPVEAEICDGLDNDCDGLVDEDIAIGCQTTCGVGRQYCVNGVLEACVLDASFIELCDGFDNDCDGEVDEGFPLGEPCVRGQGGCVSEGLFVCAPDGLEAVCDAPGPVWSPEVCDGLDNDCDGIVDDGAPCESGQVCYHGQCILD